ncbi:glycosyltransferase family 4 protein [Caulobacter sp. 17J65-9]|uniref:glycosyltransferase family 4 protein n=1 Tax=Caulobacter sp. 17J65-9 TaxID=2709382 RepID=UPI0013C9F57B|nr:glycosyltransferase family 4 protein [Caulobacter sp. 17J65-9]NEX92299.1 glycosyltransferase family 4 protein [Caulobacter sp. 17J65-9]
MSVIGWLPPAVRRPVVRTVLSGLRLARSPQWTPPAAPAEIRPGPLVVTGFMNEVLGVGRAGRMTADALEAAGWPVVRHDLRPSFFRIRRAGMTLPTERDGGVWMIHANAPEAEIAFLTHQPQAWAGRYRIGYWAWETPKAPAAWVRAAPWFHEIWATSRYTRDALAAAFRAEGRADLEPRLKVMPHPLPDVGGAKADPRRFGLEPGAFNVLSAFDARSTFVRKNPMGAVEAWRRAFPQPRPDARLTVKAVKLEADPARARALYAAVADRPDIRVLDEELTDAGVLDLVASVDAFLSLHRAEGFGLSLAEAMALGKVVVATGWSGPLDFLDADSAALVDFGLAPIRDPSGMYRGGEWAEPDLDQAAGLLRALADDPERRRRIGDAARRKVAGLAGAWSGETLRAGAWAGLVG